MEENFRDICILRGENFAADCMFQEVHFRISIGIFSVQITPLSIQRTLIDIKRKALVDTSRCFTFMIIADNPISKSCVESYLHHLGFFSRSAVCVPHLLNEVDLAHWISLSNSLQMRK